MQFFIDNLVPILLWTLYIWSAIKTALYFYDETKGKGYLTREDVLGIAVFSLLPCVNTLLAVLVLKNEADERESPVWIKFKK